MIALDGPADTDLDLRLLDLLRAWLPGRRWFPAKGTAARVDLCGAVDLTSTKGPLGSADPPRPHGGSAVPAATDRVRILLLTVHGESADTLLQVPLVLSEGPAGGHPVVGHLGTTTVLDGAGHPAFLTALLAAAEGPPGAERVRGTLEPTSGRVLTGEQSNTSVILSAGAEPVAILKVLRSPAAGDNPDIDVPRRLVEVGWDAVPAPLGWWEASWTDAAGRSVRGYLGALSVFVPGAADGFELACSYARRSAGFEELAGALGVVVASMHAALVRAYGTWSDDEVPTSGHAAGSAADAVAQAVAARFTWARQALPALGEYEDGVLRVVEQVRSLTSAPPRQRVHGDLHLGQVLRSGGRWFVTDFEGEPLAPLAERTRPDLAVRDLAGVLRSFDYAAAVGGLDGPEALSWIRGCRAAFLDGYLAQAPAGGETGVLLRALELDKALYEAVYEARNRPEWLHIPRAGLARLVAG